MITTREFAEKFGVDPNSVRRNLCVNGHYYGIKPKRLLNGRLAWPSDVPLYKEEKRGRKKTLTPGFGGNLR
jgi:hypothetical protein